VTVGNPRKNMSEAGKFCYACGAPIDIRAELCPHCGVRQTDVVSGDLRKASSDKLAAGLCGILLGALGVHKFVLGMTTPGLIMLAITVLTCGFGGVLTGTLGLVEGIIYLTRSDEEFYETYVVGKKAWL
jgi:TM2 domain-containing membrane protein YozV